MVDPNAPTEENEPVRVPAPPAAQLPRVFVAIVATCIFVATLLAVVAVVFVFSLFRR